MAITDFLSTEENPGNLRLYYFRGHSGSLHALSPSAINVELIFNRKNRFMTVFKDHFFYLKK